MPSLFRKSYGDQTRNNLYYTLQGRQIQNIKLKREQGKSLGFCVCDLTSLFRVSDFVLRIQKLFFYQKLRDNFSPDEILIIFSLSDHKHLVIPNKNLGDPWP